MGFVLELDASVEEIAEVISNRFNGRRPVCIEVDGVSCGIAAALSLIKDGSVNRVGFAPSTTEGNDESQKRIKELKDNIDKLHKCHLLQMLVVLSFVDLDVVSDSLADLEARNRNFKIKTTFGTSGLFQKHFPFFFKKMHSNQG